MPPSIGVEAPILMGLPPREVVAHDSYLSRVSPTAFDLYGSFHFAHLVNNMNGELDSSVKVDESLLYLRYFLVLLVSLVEYLRCS